ncbi:MarR family transcriptional regulator [Streptomyces antnestii]|uniref:MarR family transcriptional regulator n=1 Tax=Streptomyces antnestii TaxID=2494256 RepID=A0A3S2WKB9_9ACTN|nr:MarR family transcriptional regulator [Streptomyces sp. San01]RVU26066.1 MarR family transcriptional regulator [Streptomyces sp. San01]
MAASNSVPEPDPATADLVAMIGTFVARHYKEYEQAAGGQGLTAAQARVLDLLSHEPMPMRRIAQQVNCEPSNITGLVDRLEARGLVERRPDPADRRVKLAAPTDEGVRMARGVRGNLSFACGAVAGLTETEQEVLRGLLRKMLGGDTAD